jgi:acetaldehyde dehydrogenase (acetylating)
MGVIAGIIPVTNPTSTALFKCLAAVKSGNAIVLAPHPRAARCTLRAAEIMAEAAVGAGAPEGWSPAWSPRRSPRRRS